MVVASTEEEIVAVAEFLEDQRYDSDLVQELDDGLERLGAIDSPFTLRGQSQKYEEAAAIHAARPVATQRIAPTATDLLHSEISELIR